MNIFKMLLNFTKYMTLLLIAPPLAYAQEIQYFKGQVQIHLSTPQTCYVEISSAAPAQVQIRAVTPLEHLSSTGEVLWISVGPYIASALPNRPLYRYQDPTPGALIKDLVLQLNDQAQPQQLSLLYWHSEGAHHDPVRCQNLTPADSSEFPNILN